MTGCVVPQSASQQRGLPSTPLAGPHAARQKRCRNGDARIRHQPPRERRPDGHGLVAQGKVGAVGLPAMEVLVRTADTGRCKPLVKAFAAVPVTARAMTQAGPGHNGLPGPGRASRPYAATENRPWPHGKAALARRTTGGAVPMDARPIIGTRSISAVYVNFCQADRPRH